MRRFIFVGTLVFLASCTSVQKNTDSTLENGLIIAESGEFETAKKIFEKLCQKDDRIACSKLAELQKQQGNIVDAERNLGKACDLENYYSCYRLGEIKFNKGNLETAKILFEKSCTTIDWSCQYLGIIQWHKGNTKLAKELFENQCKREMPKGCVLRGMVDEFQGAYSEADGWYKKGCDLKSQISCSYWGIVDMITGNKTRGLKILSSDCSNGGSKTCRIVELYDSIERNNTSPKKLKNECDKGGGESCYLLGLFQSLDLKMIKSSRVTFRKACDLGNGYGCLELANFLSPYRDHKKYASLMLEGCDKGAGPACTGLSDGLFPYKVPEDRDFVEEGCEKGDGLACSKLVSRHWNSDRSKALGYYTKACRSGFIDGCYQDILAKRGTYKENEGTFKELCAKGHAASCNLVANNLSNKDKTVARTFYDRACSLNFISACYSSLNLKTEVNPSASRAEGLNDLCRYGHSDSCFENGKTLYSVGNIDRAKETLKRGCSLKSAHSCSFLGDMAKEHKQEKLALEWYERACDFGSPQACGSLKSAFGSL